MGTKMKDVKWYMAAISKGNTPDTVTVESMDVLGENFEEASRVAEQVLDETDECLAVHYMGTKEDYDLYQRALLGVQETKGKQRRMVRVSRDEAIAGSIRVPEWMPFSDDDTIELT